MSAGPIRQARDAWKPAHVFVPAVGDLVIIDDHPPGFPLWRVTSVPKGSGPSDVVDLEPVNVACPLPRTRRYIRTTRPENS